jgi:hypothetical protein
MAGIHVVRFPSEAAYGEYLVDPERVAHSSPASNRPGAS